jgi:hypothetical protein
VHGACSSAMAPFYAARHLPAPRGKNANALARQISTSVVSRPSMTRTLQLSATVGDQLTRQASRTQCGQNADTGRSQRSRQSEAQASTAGTQPAQADGHEQGQRP